MRIIDTHCHLDLNDYKDDLASVIERAVQGGVERMIVPGIDVESSIRAAGIAANYETVFAACGAHPHDADRLGPGALEKLRNIALVNDKIVAVGEVGLDYYKGYSGKEKQLELFKSSVRLAMDLDLPLIIHCRDAGDDMLKILKKTRPCAGGVMHCFSGDMAFLEEVLSMGMYVSFAGNITFEKAASLRAVAKHVPMERLLLETDSPYMAPRQVRGKRNEPSFCGYILDNYSEIYGRAAGELAEITSRNANELFRLGLEKRGAIVYPIRKSLYVNLTNRCTNRCTFCTRKYSDYVKDHHLKLDGEPSAGEVTKAIGDVSRYDEVVFCGYGEPTLRFEALKKVAFYVKANGGRVRLTTNGDGNLINGRDITPEFKGLIDRVSVSLNSPDVKEYDRICRPVYGQATHGAVIEFIRSCRRRGIEVEITCVDAIGAEGVEGVKRIAAETGASFRLRYLDVVG